AGGMEVNVAQDIEAPSEAVTSTAPLLTDDVHPTTRFVPTFIKDRDGMYTRKARSVPGISTHSAPGRTSFLGPQSSARGDWMRKATCSPALTGTRLENSA